MSALGNWIEFTPIKQKGINVSNDDMCRGKIVSIGEKVELKLKKGDEVLVSTVKKVQDLIEGETRYFVNENAIIKKF